MQMKQVEKRGELRSFAASRGARLVAGREFSRLHSRERAAGRASRQPSKHRL